MPCKNENKSVLEAQENTKARQFISGQKKTNQSIKAIMSVLL